MNVAYIVAGHSISPRQTRVYSRVVYGQENPGFVWVTMLLLLLFVRRFHHYPLCRGDMQSSDTVTLGSVITPPMCTDMMVSPDLIRATDRHEE
jgi:hypothetical protein